jgi:probable rRNA maturation factor
MLPPASPAFPVIEIHITPDAEKLSPPCLTRLEKIGHLALPSCLAAALPSENVLADLSEIEVTLMTDPEIASIHGEFLDDPTPTDVITFHHGEILISLDTAARQSLSHGLSFPDETALYLIHGLLHLAGWDDHDPAAAAAMATLQQTILQQSLTELPV